MKKLRRHPLLRLLAINLAIGVTAAIVMTGGLMWLNPGHLRDLIIAGRARPSFIVSHRLSLDEAPLAYEKFDRREDGYTKVILKPGAGKVS